MRSVLFCAVIVAILASAAPASACRVSRGPARPALPPPTERIVFTATLSQRWGIDTPGAGADLRVSRRLLGEAPDHVDATWSGWEWPPEPIAPIINENEITQVIVRSCTRRAWYAGRLQDAPMGSELAVLARRTPYGIDVQDLAQVDSEEGRRLLALAEAP